MKKKLLLLLTLSFAAVKAQSEAIFDALCVAGMHSPANEQVFFAANTADAAVDAEQTSTQPMWTGVGLGLQSDVVPSKKMASLKPSFTIGSAVADPRGSFVFGVETPFVGTASKDYEVIKNLNKNASAADAQRRVFASLSAVNASLTARGFFGPSILKNVEVVMQIAAHVPNVLNYLPTGFGSFASKSSTFGFRSNNALLLGVNWHVMPSFLRVGAFYEGLSPRFYEEGFKGLLSRSYSFAKKNAAAATNYVLSRNTEAGATAAAPVAQAAEVYLAGVACVGGFAEMQLLEDKVQVGARVKRIFADAKAEVRNEVKLPSINELCLYANTSVLSEVAPYLDLPEVGVNLKLMQNSETRSVKTSVGAGLKYRF